MKNVGPVRLGHQVERDFVEILQWTIKTFGQEQAIVYAETMTLAIESLAAGPDAFGTQIRDVVQPGVRIMHVARQGRSGGCFGRLHGRALLTPAKQKPR